MNISTNLLLSVFQTETLKIGTKNSDDDGFSDLHYSFQKPAAAADETDATRVVPEQLSYFFSNFAAKVLFDMLAHGGPPEETKAGLLFHSHGKPLDRVTEIWPYTFDFFTETGNAGGPKITVNRKVYLERSLTLKPDFHQVIQNSFNATVLPITHLTSETNKPMHGPDTKLVFEADLRMEGEWNEPFEDAGVQEFTLFDGSVVRTPFMSSKGKHYVQQFPNYKLLSVPFKQHQASRFSTLFYLPDRLEDWESLRSFLGIAESVVQAVYFPEEQVQVGEFLIPKFRMSVTGPMEFQPPLDFGRLAESFPGGMRARTSRITSELQIDEKGLKAHGFMSIPLEEKPIEPLPVVPSSAFIPLPRKMVNIDFVANRPFLFFIRDNKFGRMLYSGGLTLPYGASYKKE